MNKYFQILPISTNFYPKVLDSFFLENSGKKFSKSKQKNSNKKLKTQAKKSILKEKRSGRLFFAPEVPSDVTKTPGPGVLQRTK